MKKALIITTVSGFVPQFEMNNVRILQDMGYEIHYASNYHNVVYGRDNKKLDGSGIMKHQINFRRNPLSYGNISAYKELKDLAANGQFSLVHCHTPVGGLLGRLAFRKSQCKLIYTAHGFHFYSGANLLNWLLFYPAERLLAGLTDKLITINAEDFCRAKRFKLRNNGSVHLVDGVGINIAQIDNIPAGKRVNLNKTFNIPENALLLISVGELNKNKNHSLVLQALIDLKDKYPVYYLICGDGKEKSNLRKKAEEYGISDRVFFAGYCNNVIEILKMADIFVIPSKREGMPVSVLEAMACGLPVVGTDIRGNQDLIVDGRGGYLSPSGDARKLAKSIEKIIDNNNIQEFGFFNRQRSKNYNISVIEKKMRDIYSS